MGLPVLHGSLRSGAGVRDLSLQLGSALLTMGRGGRVNIAMLEWGRGHTMLALNPESTGMCSGCHPRYAHAPPSEHSALSKVTDVVQEMCLVSALRYVESTYHHTRRVNGVG